MKSKNCMMVTLVSSKSLHSFQACCVSRSNLDDKIKIIHGFRCSQSSSRSPRITSSAPSASLPKVLMFPPVTLGNVKNFLRMIAWWVFAYCIVFLNFPDGYIRSYIPKWAGWSCPNEDLLLFAPKVVLRLQYQRGWQPHLILAPLGCCLEKHECYYAYPHRHRSHRQGSPTPGHLGTLRFPIVVENVNNCF